MDRFILFIVGAAILFFGLTYFLHRLFKGKRAIKYIPAGLAFILALYSLYMAKSPNNQGFQDIAWTLMGVVLLASFLSGALTGVLIDFMAFKRKNG
jgi:hypothetical protein